MALVSGGGGFWQWGMSVVGGSGGLKQWGVLVVGGGGGGQHLIAPVGCSVEKSSNFFCSK